MQAIHIESYHPSGKQSPASQYRKRGFVICFRGNYSTVTLLARLRGLSTSQPRSTAM